MKVQLLILTACAFAASAQAQNNLLGFSAGNNTSYTSRVGATNVEGDVVTHYDQRDYRDCLLDPTDPTGATMRFNVMRIIVQDQLGTTADTFTIVGYTEDPLVPDFPNPAANWFRTGVINLPATTVAAPQAWYFTVTFAAPGTPAVPKGDFWLGVGLFQAPVGTTWPTDGLSTHITMDRPTTVTAFPPFRDLAGSAITQRPLPNTSCWLPTLAGAATGPATYPAAATGRQQIWIEISAPIASGVPVTQTNQAAYPCSNPGGTNPLVPLGGTTNMFSGLNPDLYDFNVQTPARQDEIGFLVSDSTVPSAPVFVLLSFGYSPVGSQPLSSLMSGLSSPTTKGNVCIDFTASATVLGFSNAAGVFQMMMTMTPATRLAYQGFAPIDLVYQGFVLNTAAPGPGITVHATGCGAQHL
jgi:hypothetical protein